jgi:hypothetical protein
MSSPGLSEHLRHNLHMTTQSLVLSQCSMIILEGTEYRFVGKGLVIENTTNKYFESWDATAAVERSIAIGLTLRITATEI